MIFSNDKCCVCPRDIEVYLSAVFLCLAAALSHHNMSIVISFVSIVQCRRKRISKFINIEIIKTISRSGFHAKLIVSFIVNLYLLLLLLFFRLKSTCSLRLWRFTHHATSSFGTSIMVGFVYLLLAYLHATSLLIFYFFSISPSSCPVASFSQEIKKI